MVLCCGHQLCATQGLGRFALVIMLCPAGLSQASFKGVQDLAAFFFTNVSAVVGPHGKPAGSAVYFCLHETGQLVELAL